MYRLISRINQRHEQRPQAVDTGHSPYERTEPPEPWQPGWQTPVIDAASPEHQDRLLAFNIVHHWKPTEEKASEDLG